MTIDEMKFWETCIKEYAGGEYDGVTVILHGNETQMRYFGSANAEKALTRSIQDIAMDAFEQMQNGDASFLDENE